MQSSINRSPDSILLHFFIPIRNPKKPIGKSKPNALIESIGDGECKKLVHINISSHLSPSAFLKIPPRHTNFAPITEKPFLNIKLKVGSTIMPYRFKEIMIPMSIKETIGTIQSFFLLKKVEARRA